MTHRLATVIIPARNAAAWLPEQLQSLADQIDAPDFDVIVADNGSTDDTADVIAQHHGSPTVTLVDASGLPSASFARNVGAQTAAGEILLFCDADDIVSPYWVHDLVRAVEASNGAIAAGSLHHERFNAPSVLHAYGIGPDPELPVRDESLPPYVEDAQPFAGLLPTVAGGNFAMRAEDYLRLGGMDPSYPGGSEETDFSWRAQIDGLRVVRVPQAVVHYRLKHDPRTVFRQQRIQQRARMLLWTRYRDHGMSGPSWKGSLQALGHEILKMPTTVKDRDGLLASARRAGGHAGAIEGMLKYRFLPTFQPRNRADSPVVQREPGFAAPPVFSQKPFPRALRLAKAGLLNIVRSGPRTVDFPVDNARLGNLLYIWMNAMTQQRDGKDFRVAVTKTSTEWLAPFTAVHQDLLVERRSIGLTDRRISGGYYQGFGTHFTVDDLNEFCTRYLLDSPLMRQFKAEAIDLGMRDEHQVTVNVRRGDYYSVPQHRDRYGLDIEGFVSAAIQEQLKFGPISDVYLISDDVPWCLEHLTYLEERGITLHASPSSSPARDLALLGHSDRLVLTNSTFSYWGGYMATVRNPHSNIVVPLFHAKDWLNGRAFQLHPDWTALPGFGED